MEIISETQKFIAWTYQNREDKIMHPSSPYLVKEINVHNQGSQQIPRR